MNLDLQNSILSFLPEIVLILAIGLIPLHKALLAKFGIKTGYIAVTGVGISLILSIIQILSLPTRFFGSMIVLDHLVAFANIAVTFTTLAIIFITESSDIEESNEVEHFVFIIAIALGCMLFASSVNLVMLFVSAALIDTGLIMLMNLKLPQGSENSGSKYFTYSLIISALTLIGISILYGISGSMDYYSVSIFLSIHPFNSTTLLLSVLLILAGFASKMLLIPFHLPVLKGSKSFSLTAFGMILCPVLISAFIAAARFFITVFQSAHLVNSNILSFTQIPNFYWDIILMILALIGLTFSSVLIADKVKLRKIILYSVTAQSSLLLLGLSSVSRSGLASAITILISIGITIPGLLYLLSRIETGFGTSSINELAGSSADSKWLFGGTIILLLSLAGLPVTIGFSSRLFLYTSLSGFGSVWVIVISVMNSLLICFVCVKLFRNFFLLNAPKQRKNGNITKGAKIILLIILIPAILFGLYIDPITRMAEFFCQIYGIK